RIPDPQRTMRTFGFALLCLVLLNQPDPAVAQSLGNAGTIEGTVTDPAGAVVAKAEVTLRNAVTGYMQTAVSGPDGAFRLSNIPQNPYRIQVTAPGFAAFTQTIDVSNSIPVQVKATRILRLNDFDFGEGTVPTVAYT